MVPPRCARTAPVPPRPYQRAPAKQPTALHVTALALGTALRLSGLCRPAMRAAHRRHPDPIRAPKRVLAHLWEGEEMPSGEP